MNEARGTTLFLAGDVMTGRGIDQILPFPGDPEIPEAYMRDARGYVRLAEDTNGPIARPVALDHVWGELRGDLARIAPAARIVNLETSITRRGAPWPDKEVHYRMTPENVGCLVAAELDVCTLANNHVLDYGQDGLLDTLAALAAAGIATAGAGRDRDEASRPAILDLGAQGRVIVLAIGADDCGIPPAWAAGPDRPGVDLVADFSERSIAALCARVADLDRPGDVVVVSVHWGSNWGYAVPEEHVQLAHRVIDAGADLVFGHSSHHPRPIEVYRDRLILYGCGDLVNDYEGIGNRDEAAFRGELALAYFPELDRSGALIALSMSPMQIRKMRLERPAEDDVAWLEHTLDGACAPFGTRVARTDDARLTLRWR